MRATRSLADADLRVAYLKSVLRGEPVEALAEMLDVLCARAESADVAAREVLVALVDALNARDIQPILERLREEAAGARHLSLDRFIRVGAATALGREDPDPDRVPPPDYGKGRPLTLGERKSLARKPDRALLERLLADPHPAVIQRVLRNPRLTEDDVLRVAARRPCRADVLAEIAREPRWAHRPRIRLALVLNPSTPRSIGVAATSLLSRAELREVLASTHAPREVHAAARAHLALKPPMPRPGDTPLH